MERTHLKPGTRIQLEHGSLYEIIGEPIGSGGGSVIYPACQLLEQGEAPDGIVYALKECYPISYEHRFFRDSHGQICPEPDAEGGQAYLDQVKEMQLRERQITQQIYKTSSRLLPIRESASRVTLTPPDGVPVWVENTVTVMESLSAKGQSLESYLRHCRRMTTAQTFHIVRQLLFALREVHQAGYLHLDLQGKNLFLRGDLSDGSDMVTIIDFGSSRPLVNGRTEPIRDRVIFTTRGFSAPEILRENDGSLQLGPEADLYSVGCLILYLLTGSVYSPEELQSNTTGLYLTRFKLRRIDCPKHLVSRLQAIIARALEKRPEDRYHSAGEMLEDVGDFCAALQPYRSDLAAVAYDAFLCYRHGPVDSPAARTLQRSLEQFRTAWGPGSRRPFDRVFLDEGELSSCADMGEQIRAALKNAGWLVVICSPATPSSPWVQLEIDTFLEYHDRSRVLAVLTAGEPKESFPPQLLAGDGHQEVLAADARGKDVAAVLRRLKRDALFRIAAPMLGTTYDALRQRRQIYRLQRAAVAATFCLAAAIAFSIYAFRREQFIARQAAQLQAQTEQLALQAQQLEEEYQNTLLEQSRYLLGDAQDRLAENDVLGAIQRLVAALPSADQDRPVLPGAVYALTEALGVYESPGNEGGRLTPVGSVMLPKDTNSSLLMNSTGQYLFTSDRDTVYVWDAETSEIVHTLSDSDVDCVSLELTGEMLMTTEPHLLLDCFSSLVCWDYTTGEVVWQTEIEKYICTAALSEDESSVILLEANCLQRLSTEDGSVLQTIPLSETDVGYYDTPAVSADGEYAAFVFRDYNFDQAGGSTTTIYLAAMEQGAIAEVMTLRSDFSLDAMAFVENHLVVASSDYGYGHVRCATKCANYFSYDLISKQTEWDVIAEVSDHALFYDFIPQLLPILYSDGETERPALILFMDSSIYVIDRETGELLKDYETSSPIVSGQLLENGFCVYTRDGLAYKARFTSPYFSYDSYFTGPITDVCWDPERNVYYTILRTSSGYSSSMITYEYERSDSAYTELYSTEESSWSSPTWIDGLICNDYSHSYLEDALSLFDPHDGTVSTFLFSETEESVSIRDYARAGDGRYLDYIIGDRDSPVLRRLDLNAETWTDYELPVPVELCENEYWTIEQSVLCDEGVLYLGTISPPHIDANQAEDGGSYQWDIVWVLASWTPGEDAEVIARYSLPLMEYTVSPSSEPGKTYTILSSSGSCAYNSLHCDPKTKTVQFRLSQPVYQQDQYIGNAQYLVSVDLATQALDAFQLKADLSIWTDSTIYGNTGSYWAEISHPYEDEVCTGTDILIFDTQGNLLHTLRYAETYEFPDFFFSPDDAYLCAVGSSGLLRLYDTETGTLTEEMDLEAESQSSLYSFSDVQPVTEDCLLLLLGDTGVLLDFSGIEPGVTAIIENCLGYDPEGNRFLVDHSAYSDNTTVYQIGAFHHYSLQELVELGQARVGQEQSGSGETEDP